MFYGKESTCCNHMCCAHCGYEIPDYDNREKQEWSYDCDGEKIYEKDLKILIESCCPKDKRTLNGLIIQCLRHNGLDALEALPGLGFRVGPMNDKQQTIIHLAFYMNAHDTLNYGQGSLLLKCEKNHMNYVDSYGLSHLHVACVTGDTDVVREFLDKSEDVNALFHSDPEGSRTNFTPLHFAAANECTAVAELLLRHGADINTADIYGRTPLHLACFDPETISRRVQGDELIELHWKSNRRNSTNIELAIVELLLDYGADPNAGDEKGNTPLFYCFQKFNVDVSRVDRSKDKRIADLKSRQRKIFELLLKHGADVTVVNSDNENILHWIVKDLQSFRLPVAYASISFDDTLYAGLIEQIFVLNQEIDVNAANSNGETPLQLAVSLMSVEVVKILLKHNADLKKLDQKNQIQFVYPNIPLDLKALQNIINMIELLANKDYHFSLEDNLTIMKLLVHNYKKCDCTVVKGDENVECIIVNALYYGSLTHLNDVGQNFGETSKSRSRYFYSSSQSKSDKLQEYTYYYLDCKKRLGLFDKRQNILKKLKNKKYNDYKLNKLVENLDAEVVRMKSTLLKNEISGKSTTLYNIMKRHYSEIYHYIKGKDMDKLVTAFPSYEKLIKGHVAKSLTRRYLENSASNYLKVLSPSLADVCYKMIIFYLSNEDILNVSIAVLPSGLSP